MPARYRFTLATVEGVPLSEIAAYVSADYILAENEVTPLNMILPASEIDRESFEIPDGRIYIERAATEALPLELEGNTCWFIRKFDQYDGPGGESLIDLTAYNANYLLDGPIIPYGVGNTSVPGSVKLAPGDDMMKAIVRENLGSLASDTDRSLAGYLTVAANAGAGPTLLKEFSYRKVLETVQEVAEACLLSSASPTWVGFNTTVNPANGLLTFRTYIGQSGTDRTTGSERLVISTAAGNLINSRYSQDWSEARTVVYAGGQGVGEVRAVLEVEDTDATALSVFNRRELFVNSGNSADTDALTSEANAALRANGVKRVFTGDISETESTLYGIHFRMGDLVSADYRKQGFDARVSRIHVHIENKEDKVQASLRSDN